MTPPVHRPADQQSSLVPDQQDAILYTYSWNGQYWLVAYNDGTLIDYSKLVSSLTYVNWVSNTEDLGL